MSTAMALLIKENCWKWDNGSGTYFVKYYNHLHVAEKVRMIHKKLSGIEFPYSISLKPNQDPQSIVQSWHEAKSANYEDINDRLQAIDCLQALHETNQVINWQKEPLLPQYSLIDKWTVRLNRFMAHETELIQLLGRNYESIVNVASLALREIRNLQIPSEKPTLLHGDVVHHNILVSPDSVPKLIDFDLAALGDASDEVILWLQRALPNVGYQLKNLLNEHEYLNIAMPKLPYLLYPNEVMREALYMLRVEEAQREPLYQFLMPFTKEALANWSRLQYAVQSVYA